jgi:hypothetical protein
MVFQSARKIAEEKVGRTRAVWSILSTAFREKTTTAPELRNRPGRKGNAFHELTDATGK